MMGKCLFMRKGETHTAPVTGILAGDLAVGSSVYLMENGSAVEYLVVNQGIPSGSSLYDASCDGTWLLRKDIFENRQWHSSNSNNYKASTIHSYLNSTFLGLLDSDIQAVVKQVKIPYVNGTGSGGSVASGSNGLSAKIFLLSGYEVGLTKPDTVFPIDGACLDYFRGTSSFSGDSKRIGYLNGAATYWWLRSPRIDYTDLILMVDNNGGPTNYACSSVFGVRPALILPYNAIFDETTMLLKGVK